jgi:hypothetical protein
MGRFAGAVRYVLGKGALSLTLRALGHPNQTAKR